MNIKENNWDMEDVLIYFEDSILVSKEFKNYEILSIYNHDKIKAYSKILTHFLF